MRNIIELSTISPRELVLNVAEYKLAFLKSKLTLNAEEWQLIEMFFQHQQKLKQADQAYVQELLRKVSLSFVPPYPWDETHHGFIKNPAYFIKEEDPLKLSWQTVPWNGIVCRQMDVHQAVVAYYKNHFKQGSLVKPSTAYFDNDKGVWIIANGTHRLRALWELIFQNNTLPKLPIANSQQVTLAITHIRPRFINYTKPGKLIIK